MDKEWQSGKSLAQTNMVMFENEVDADVTFTFPGLPDKIHAHRFILKSRSHAFFVLFHNDLIQSTRQIEIQDIEPAVFKLFLTYLYSGELTLTTGNALHLLYAAEKYETLDLKAKCVKFLQENITKENVADILDKTIFGSV